MNIEKMHTKQGVIVIDRDEKPETKRPPEIRKKLTKHGWVVEEVKKEKELAKEAEAKTGNLPLEVKEEKEGAE